jgi:hypothetical protein
MEAPLPFPQSYWVVPGKLMAGQYPGWPQPDEAGRRITALCACGVRHVINLMEANEVNDQGQPFVPYIEQLRACAAAAESDGQVGWSRYPIRDGSIPTRAVMHQILDEIDLAIDQGRTVYVHCWGGKGRTGTLVGCYLIRHHLATPQTVLEAITRLRAAIQPFQPSPETEEQRAFVCSWKEPSSEP